MEAAKPPAFTHKRPDWTPRALHEGLQLSPSTPESADERALCPRCGASRCLYCHTCVLPLSPLLPRVELPFNVWVLTHCQQNESTATGVHLAVLAPRVRLLAVEDLPELCRDTAVVLYPEDSATPADEVDVASIRDVVVIDSKWGQARGVLLSPALAGVRRVRLGSYRTSYWRYHTRGVPEDGLCTVEAVFFLCRSLHAKAHAGGQACHCFDDLLYIFSVLHARVLREADRRRLCDAG
jgi:DTW domain-containing protein YfiP